MFGKSVTSFEDITPKNKNWFFLLTLTLISMAGLIGSNLYLPVLPEIGLSLHKDMVAIQVTLGIYLFGLSFGQLILGPLIDHYGRKKLLILGMRIYFLASLSCAFSFFLLSNACFKVISSLWSLFRSCDWKSYNRKFILCLSKNTRKMVSTHS